MGGRHDFGDCGWRGAVTAPHRMNSVLPQAKPTEVGWKDTIAHLTTWWRREVGRLASMQRGERPIDHPSQADVAVINQWIYLVNRDRPAGDVLRDAEAAWHELGARVRALPEAALLGGEQLDWTEGQPAGVAIVEGFLRHFHEEHEQPIRGWLNALAATS